MDPAPQQRPLLAVGVVAVHSDFRHIKMTLPRLKVLHPRDESARLGAFRRLCWPAAPPSREVGVMGPG